VGKVSDDSRVVVHDDRDDSFPVNLELQDVLGDNLPQKVFHIDPVCSRSVVSLFIPDGFPAPAPLSTLETFATLGFDNHVCP
jgi:hypothetical protein